MNKCLALFLIFAASPSRAIVIDYANPKAYLKSGTQSFLSEENFKAAAKGIKMTPEEAGTIKGIGKIFFWIRENFEPTQEFQGDQIGKSTANELMKSRLMSGCHDWGLMLATLLRRFKYPAVMVDAAGVQWAQAYAAKETNNFSGHVFVEVAVGGKWILVDSTNARYVKNYQPYNQGIPIDVADQTLFFVLHKGLDPADYGITDKTDLHESMKKFAKKSVNMTFPMPDYDIRPLPR